MKKIRIIMIILLFIPIIGGIGSFFYYQQNIKAVSKDDQPVVFEVKENATYSQIIDDLYEHGLIRNVMIAKIHLRINDVEPARANVYLLNKNMDLKTIFKILGMNGNHEYLVTSRFTITEGSTVPQVASVIAEFLSTPDVLVTQEEILIKMSDPVFLNTMIDKYWFLTDEILNEAILFPLEGYLYPETYIVASSENDFESIMDAILGMSDTVLSSLRSDIETSNWSVHEFLSFASVVESESLFDHDKAIIAGVFVNRLNTGMLLQSDITVLYALQERRIDVYYEDLAVDSYYNTYKYLGLPVGPVSNVSKITMEASLNYAQHDFVYFFAIPSGEVIYTKTFAEHEAAIQEAKSRGEYWD